MHELISVICFFTLQEDCPLASLPLLGYTVSTPSEKDGIQKDFVFKLQFKNHIYFFRAESEYTFSRFVYFCVEDYCDIGETDGIPSFSIFTK